ncbi:MAG: monosaccharide-transporting ATPase [Candidatus Binatia bacterium]|nr:MAG: monosaccharide-transporting ATPase [Candidatus Binatia bacterium]
MNRRGPLHRFALVPGWSAAALLILEIALFTWLLAPADGRPHPFANLANFALVLKYSAVFSLGAIAAALIIGSGGIDLAPGAVMALASVVAGHLLTVAAWPWGAAAVASLAVGTTCGIVAAVLVTAFRLPPFVATLGVMGVARGSAFLMTEGRFYDLSAYLPRDFAPLGIPLPWWPGLLVVVCTASFHIVLTRTALGRHILAVGSNPVAARYAGVSVTRVQAFVYVCGGFIAALAGLLLAFVQGQGKADLAMGYELDIIAAAVVGGTSLSGGRASVVGAVFGALIFGVLRNALTQFPGGTYADRLVLGVAVLIVVVLDRLATRQPLGEGTAR